MSITPNTRITCSRCGRQVKAMRATDWNVTMRRGVVVGHLCPNCQTPEENAEAVMNEATTSYAQDSFGRVIGTTKVSA